MIIIGRHTDNNKGLLTIPKRDLLRHTAVIGQSGSGKSFAIARLVEELVLRTRARVVILDPNGDFSKFHEPASAELWENQHFLSAFQSIRDKSPQNVTEYDSMESFSERWLSRRFQSVSADLTSWSPFRDGAFAAPLKLHWKFLGSEQDFLLRVNSTDYPKISQGIVSCFHYVDDNEELYKQGYSLDDLESIAQEFALGRVAMANYPEAASLEGVDWLAVRLQFRDLRKRFYKLWFPGLLREQERAPSDLSNYLRNGFRAQAPWQACVVGLAGLDVDHMLLAANTALYHLWNRSIAAWQQARIRPVAAVAASTGSDTEAGPDIRRDMTETDAPLELREPREGDRTSTELAAWQDRRVPTRSTSFCAPRSVQSASEQG